MSVVLVTELRCGECGSPREHMWFDTPPFEADLNEIKYILARGWEAVPA